MSDTTVLRERRGGGEGVVDNLSRALARTQKAFHAPVINREKREVEEKKDRKRMSRKYTLFRLSNFIFSCKLYKYKLLVRSCGLAQSTLLFRTKSKDFVN